MFNKLPNITGHVQKRFIAGLLLCLPIFVTLFALNFLFNIIDSLFEPLLGFIPWVSEHTTGVSAAITLAFIYLVGIVSSHVVGKRLINFFLHTLPQRIPVINTVYSLARDFIDAISPGDDGKITGKVVMVQLSPFDPEPKMMGLLMSITRIITETSDKLNGAVFFSSSPFPQSGQLIWFPLSKISDVRVPSQIEGTFDEIWMSKKEFLQRDAYMKVVASMATHISKALVLQKLDAESFLNTKPADKS